MEILLTRTGDPWMDWGLVALYDFALNNKRSFEKVEITYGTVYLKTRTNAAKDKYITLFYNYLRECLNHLILPAPEMKVLGMEYRVKWQDGFYDPDYTVTLTAQQKKQLKDQLNNITAKPGVTLRRNYVGLKKDWKKLAGELEEGVTKFFEQHDGCRQITQCQLCGRPMGRGMAAAMRQNKNPFYNQHHNNKVRGHANTVTTGDMCPTCNLLNIFAALQYNLPYYIDSKRTHLILPRIDDLTILHKIFANINSRLLDLQSPDVISYSTNIKGLRRNNLYQALIGIYFNIVHQYIPEEDTFKEDSLLNKSQQQSVRRWVVLRYSKGQNVSFVHFNHLDINPRLFDVVQGMEYGTNKDKFGNVYTTFLNGIFCREPRTLNQLARGIVENNLRLVAESLLSVKKEADKAWASSNGLSFFEVFIEKIVVEVDKLLEKQLAEDIKVVGRCIGYNFSDDIALFTSFNNAPDAAALRHVMREAFFKMYKKSAAQKKNSEKQTLLVPGEKRVENIINSINEENIEAVKDTLLIYATLSALRGYKDNNEETNTQVEVQ